MKHGLAHKSKGQLGASMVEYALLVALVALIAIPAVKGLGGAVSNQFDSAAVQIAGEGSIQCEPSNPAWPGCLP